MWTEFVESSSHQRVLFKKIWICHQSPSVWSFRLWSYIHSSSYEFDSCRCWWVLFVTHDLCFADAVCWWFCPSQKPPWSATSHRLTSFCCVREWILPKLTWCVLREWEWGMRRGQLFSVSCGYHLAHCLSRPATHTNTDKHVVSGHPRFWRLLDVERKCWDSFVKSHILIWMKVCWPWLCRRHNSTSDLVHCKSVVV